MQTIVTGATTVSNPRATLVGSEHEHGINETDFYDAKNGDRRSATSFDSLLTDLLAVLARSGRCVGGVLCGSIGYEHQQLV